jgi:hypothetical protein
MSQKLDRLTYQSTFSFQSCASYILRDIKFIYCVLPVWGESGSVVGLVTRLRDGRLRIRGPSPGRGKRRPVKLWLVPTLNSACIYTSALTFLYGLHRGSSTLV